MGLSLFDGQSTGRFLAVGQGSLSALDPLGDAVSDFFIDAAPLVERTLAYRFGHAFFEVPDDIRDQPITLGPVHDLTDQGAGLAKIIIIFPFCVGGTN